MEITDEMVEALATLREYRHMVRRYVRSSPLEERVARAVGVLDDAEFFNPIDHATPTEEG